MQGKYCIGCLWAKDYPHLQCWTCKKGDKFIKDDPKEHGTKHYFDGPMHP